MKKVDFVIFSFLICLCTVFYGQNTKKNENRAAETKIEKKAKVEIVASIEPPIPDMSGIAVTKDHRIFLSFPRHADNHKMFSLAEYKNGKCIPFPDKRTTYPSNLPYDQWLVSPHGMTLDERGNLWIIDDGKRAGIKGIPEGAAKVVGINPDTKKIIARIVIKAPVLHQDSHFNDLRVDLNHGEKGTVYITNSSFGHTPSLVVVDIASGKSREMLVNQKSTMIQPGYMAFLEGQPRVYNEKNVTLPSGGADGIALVNNSVYITSISGRGLYSISTDILSDSSKTEEEIEKAVKYEGDRPSCDGLAEDENGNIYFGAYEQMALVCRTPDGQYRTLAGDRRFGWPDGLFHTSDGYLYVTLGQWNRLPGFNGGKDLRKSPYLVARIKTDLEISK